MASPPYDVSVTGVGVPNQQDLKRAADFRLALRRFQAVTERAVRSAGLTSRQYLLLLVIESTSQRDGVRLGDLANALELVPSSMTELIDRAERAGLLERVHDSVDGRVTHVRSTTEGRARLRTAFRELADERETLARSTLSYSHHGS
jgi:DNA-binding MarR family transcriptional regulator